jgi:hypothetical protein
METAEVRCAICTAFIDGMTFNAALAEAANRSAKIGDFNPG